MGLKEKYAKLLDFARTSNIQNLTVSENDNVLRIIGSTSTSVKNKMWDIYNELDPDMRSGDLVMNITEVTENEEIYEVKSGDNLSKIASKYPGMTWQKIFDANKDIIKNPDMIRPGQKLRIPL